MKPNLHPPYHDNVRVTCACGNKFVTGSTAEAIQVEVCANCHPFFTGKGKLIDTAGRVDKFKARLERAKTLQQRKIKRPAVSTVKPTVKGQLVETSGDKTEEKPDEK